MSHLKIGVVGGGAAEPFKAAIEEHGAAVRLAGAAPADPARARAFICETDLDAVAVFAPPGEAVEACLAGLERGAHVLCGRRPCDTLGGMDRLIAAEAGSAGLLRVAMPLRQHASVAAALNFAANGVFGPLKTARAVYGAYDGAPGALMRFGYPLFDLLHAFCGAFDEVRATLSGPPGDEDNALVMVRAENGALAQLHVSSTALRQTFRVELGYERGYLWLDGLRTPAMDFAPEMFIIGRGERGPDGRLLANPDEDVHEMPLGRPEDELLEAFLDAAAGGQGGRLATAGEARDALDAVHRAYASDPHWGV